MSYDSYVRGLRMLEGDTHPETEDDWVLLTSVLDSLHGAIIGAGSNTWLEAAKRYERARMRYDFHKKEAGRE